MPAMLTHQLLGQTLLMLGERALFWKEAKMLVVADIHLGKAGVFREQGIPVPPGSSANDLDRLSRLLDQWRPRRLVFLGDLIHGAIDHPRAFNQSIAAWRDRHRTIEVLLATGNHDRQADDLLAAFRLDGIEAKWALGPFLFTHRPRPNSEAYSMAGHLHPAVTLTGKGRQRETLPCFCFGPQGALLPAFGSFTGTQRIHPSRRDRVVVVAGNILVDMAPPSASPSG